MAKRATKKIEYGPLALVLYGHKHSYSFEIFEDGDMEQAIKNAKEAIEDVEDIYVAYIFPAVIRDGYYQPDTDDDPWRIIGEN